MALIPEDFRTFLHNFLDNWKSIDIRVVALKRDIGWVFHSIKIRLDTNIPKETASNLPNVDELLVVHEIRDINQIYELLEQIEIGELIVGGETILIKNFNGSNWALLSNLNYRLYDKDDCVRRFKIKYPSSVLEGYSGNQLDYETKQVLDHKLRSGRIPWDGMLDLRSNFVGLGPDWASRDDSLLSVVAPIYIHYIKSELVNETLKIMIEKPDTIKYEDISASLISHHEEDQVFRSKISLTGKTTEIILKNKPLMLKLIVSYRDYVIDSGELFAHSENLRINVYQDIIGDIKLLNEEFSNKKRYFEAQILLLFHLLGLSPAYYGYSTQNVPDILVFSNDNKFVLVVECTTREPDINNKLTKLSTRTKEIKEVTSDIPVIPVLVTAFPNSKINTSDLEKASTEQVALITKDEITTLITMSLEQKTSEQVYDFINSLIPFDESAYSRRYYTHF